jgi:predicted Rossmann fold nucleotide-binding protein DprA/Smf involved in DNA uptake
VIEAGVGSGALITAEAARCYGRRVVALLGSAGCDALSRSGGTLVGRTVEDLVARIESQPAPPPPLPVDPRAERLYRALDGVPRDLGEVAQRAGLRADEALAAAVELELGGLAARAAGGRYHRLSW